MTNQRYFGDDRQCFRPQCRNVRYWRIAVYRRYAANFRPPPERKLASGMAKAAFDGYCHGDIATGRRVLACVQSHPLLVNPA
ncbi:hypothetical protein GOL21_13005 [Sinorhizobium medicae]|nr:hypothetical protein [Sinorhizobium medicae]